MRCDVACGVFQTVVSPPVYLVLHSFSAHVLVRPRFGLPYSRNFFFFGCLGAEETRRTTKSEYMPPAPRERTIKRLTTPGGVPAMRLGGVPTGSPLFSNERAPLANVSKHMQIGTPAEPPRPGRIGLARQQASAPSKLESPQENERKELAWNTPNVRPPAPVATTDPAHPAAQLPAQLPPRPESQPTPPMPPPPPPAAPVADWATKQRDLEERLAAAERRADGLARDNARLLEELSSSQQKPQQQQPPSVMAQQPQPPVEDDGFEERLAVVSSKLWEGARRATELAAERRELLDRCSRAEAAAQSARDACARLSTKLAATLGVDGSNGGSLSARPSAVGTAVGRSHGTPASAGASLTREELLQRGRATFEAHRRRESSFGGASTATPST